MALIPGLKTLSERFGQWAWRGRVVTGRERSRGMVPGRPSMPPGDRIGGDPEIAAMIEHQVIPMLIHAAAPATISRPPPAQSSPFMLSPAEVERFALLAVEADTPSLMAVVDQHCADGAPFETILIDLLAPAARLLGRCWEEDSRDFVDVTMGLWRIQEVLHAVTARMPRPAHPGEGARRILLSPMPGDDHSLGTLMLAECFVRAGWDADVLMAATASELHEKYAHLHYDVIGLTVSCDCSTALLRSMITTIRAVSTNPDIRIMIGGRWVASNPWLVEECGADGTAGDAPGAVALAELLVPLRHLTRRGVA